MGRGREFFLGGMGGDINIFYNFAARCRGIGGAAWDAAPYNIMKNRELGVVCCVARHPTAAGWSWAFPRENGPGTR